MTISDSEGFWNGEVSCVLCGMSTINRVIKKCDDCLNKEKKKSMSSAGHYADLTGMGGTDFPELPKAEEELNAFSKAVNRQVKKMKERKSCQGAGVSGEMSGTYASQIIRDRTNDNRIDDNNYGGVSHPEVFPSSTSVSISQTGNSAPVYTPNKETVEQMLNNNKPTEYKQITPQALQSGFKAADSKATFDLLPPEIFENYTRPLIPKDKLCEQVSENLFNFWRNPNLTIPEARNILFDALDAAFNLLAKECDGSICKALFAVGELYAIGKKKYAARNWELGIDWGIVYSAAWRHFLKQYVLGEYLDPVDKQIHVTSTCWNIIALIYYVSNPDKYKKFDSRIIVERAKEEGQK